MEGNNNAPFEKGQKVVAINDGWMSYSLSGRKKMFSKGDVFIVLGVEFCCKWRVDVGFISDAPPCGCGFCGHSTGDIALACAKLFAPIQRRLMEISIDKEVLDSLPKITEERSDVIVQPQESEVKNQLLDTIDEMIALLPTIPVAQRFEYAQKVSEMINRTCKLIRGEE